MLALPRLMTLPSMAAVARALPDAGHVRARAHGAQGVLQRRARCFRLPQPHLLQTAPLALPPPAQLSHLLRRAQCGTLRK